MTAAAQIELVGFHVLRRLLFDGLFGLRADRQLECLGDVFSNLLLYAEHVFELAVEALRPDVIAIVDINELCRDAKLVSGFANTAFEDCVDV